MRKLKFDNAAYPEGKSHCFLLSILMRSNAKFFVSSFPKQIRVQVKKPAIEELMRRGLFAYANPRPIGPHEFEITLVVESGDYSPFVQSIQDFSLVPAELLPAYISKTLADYQRQEEVQP